MSDTKHKHVYDNETGTWVPVVDPVQKEVAVAKRVDSTRFVGPATTGTCMFCSDPSAAFAFRGDDSVRICGKCVKG